MDERECVGPEILRCSVGKWAGRAKPKLGTFLNNLGKSLLHNPDIFFCASGPEQNAGAPELT
jgi:hypothetical protein